MAEQQSRRSNNVTGAGFDLPFETQALRFGAGSLNLKYSLDAMDGWSRLSNSWHENEGEAIARPGQTSLATHGAGTTCHSVRKLRSPSAGTMTRLVGAGPTVHRGASGATTSVSTGYSGDPLALVPHRPTVSSDPWMFIGDRSKMQKVRADGLAVPIGLPIPTSAPTTALDREFRRSIATCSASDSTAAASWTKVAGKDEGGVASGVPTVADEFSVPGGTTPDLYTTTVPGAITKPYDSWIGIGLTRDLTTLSPMTGVPGDIPATDDDLIHFWIKTSHPHLIQEIRVYLVVSSVFDATVLPCRSSAGGGTSAADVKALRRTDFAQYLQGTATQISAAEEARVHAMRDQDLEDRAIDDARGSWAKTRAAEDPERKMSLELAAAAHHWMEMSSIGIPIRRGDFERIGNSLNRDWSTVTGIVLYVKTSITASDLSVAFGFGDFYLTGGRGPDSAEPGAQQYDYRVTNYDPRTGAESNGSVVQAATAYLDALRRGLVVTPPAYGDAAIRQRVYRRGGSLFDDWYFVGVNTADGGVFTDTMTDINAAASGTLPIDHFQPAPTVDANGTTVLAQPLPALWGPLEGMLFGCGDPYRPGYVYFSLAGQPDHWSSSGNVEVCAPSEELMNGGLVGHQGFVFSRARLYFLYPNLSGGQGVTASPTLCTRGLLGRWSFCTGPGGLIYFVAEDGVFATQGGPEQWLSEAINPLFYGTAVNGYQPIDKTAVSALRLTVWENALYFQYQDTAGARQVLVYSILQKFWRHYNFGRAPAVVQGEDENILLLGGLSTGASYTLSGFSDDTLPIACTIRTGSASGTRREEKLFGDLFLDADTAGVTLTLQVFLNEETYTNVAESIAPAGAGRQRFLVHAFGASPQKAHSIACEVRWSSATATPTLYQFGYAVTLQPDLTNTRVTNWDDCNSPDEVWLTGVTLDCDTGGVAKTILIERDFGGAPSTVATFTVTSSNRHKVKFSWPAVPANLVRIRPDAAGCAPWLLYRADWIYLQEPPRISKWDMHFENGWDQYYTGLDLYCDTGGVEKRIEVYVDNVRLTNALGGGLTYWPITTSGRQVVHLTLPWGRGHVFRFVAIDDNAGLLYKHHWQLQAEPSEQANWNQNFSILNTHADKWLKAILFECDTFGQNKSVSVEVDGTAVETLTVNTSGRKVVQLALSQQYLGRVWRIFPTDANPGRLYSAEPIFDEEPFALTRWETQETNHNLPGWFYPLYGHLTLKSTAPVTLTTIVQHNQVGGTTTRTYTVPSTSGQKQRRFLNGFVAGKGVLIKYLLTSPEPFWLYRDETTLVIQPWGAYEAITVHPFGNHDQDPSRPMTHALLAAQSSGGAVAPGESA